MRDISCTPPESYTYRPDRRFMRITVNNDRYGRTRTDDSTGTPEDPERNGTWARFGWPVVAKPPAFERGAPPVPPCLDGAALEEWRKVTPTLEALELLKPEDAPMLASYCLTWGVVVDMSAVIRAEGFTAVNPSSGRCGAAPCCGDSRGGDSGPSAAGAALRVEPMERIEFGGCGGAQQRRRPVRVSRTGCMTTAGSPLDHRDISRALCAVLAVHREQNKAAEIVADAGPWVPATSSPPRC